jgi:pyruvate dehydrogenase E2 component (dihydrolipoamide acetyltransferase)
MPEIAANTTSASIVSWSVNEGDAVSAGDCLAEIESEKAVVELEAEEAGVMGQILVQAGVETDVGAAIAVMLQAGEQGADVEALLHLDAQLDASGKNVEGALQANGHDVKADVALAQVDMAPASPVSRPLDASKESSLEAASQGGDVFHHDVAESQLASAESTRTAGLEGQERIIASPIARRLARENNISLAGLTGSGPEGRIVKRDVLAAGATLDSLATLTGSSTSPSTTARSVTVPTITPRMDAAAAARGAYTDLPHTSMRRTIARRLSESKATIPHFYLRADCRMDALLALRAQVNEDATRKISVNDFIVKAVAAALGQVPEMNVSWTDDALRCYQHIDIAVAVSTDQGLITPVIHDADTLLLSTVSAQVADLARRAREGALEPREYQGGSFTISNLGMFGVSEFAAIINPPQAAILAVGAAEQRAVVVDGALSVASVMTVTLSVDHRAIDGALAARWLGTFKRIVEHPALALV